MRVNTLLTCAGEAVVGLRDTVFVVRNGGVLRAEGSAVDSFNATPAGGRTG